MPARVIWELKNVFVEDRKLSTVLLALAGQLIEPPVPIPVTDAEAKNGKVASTLPTELQGQSGPARFAHWVLTNNYDSVNSKMARQFLESIGHNPDGSGNLLNHLKSLGFIYKPKAREGQRGDWLVNTTAMKGEK